MVSEINASERRLAAIAFTDIVGYTALTQRDESKAIELLQLHNALIRSVLRGYRGKEIKTIGDSFLLEFESALEAVLCAIEIQRAFRDRKEMPESELVLRIGIHVGDVIVQSNDIYGDAVNIASRIVKLAEPSGICISEQVFAQVRNKVVYEFVKLAPQHLKNVDSDIVLYLLRLPWQREERRADLARSIQNRIAILPFSNISPEPLDSYFADGLTEELISTLSEIHGLRVIARSSVSRYRDSANKDISQIGNELQVAFILEGSVRKAGNKIRVSTQLIDVTTQEPVWSNHFDRNLDDVFAIQTEIAKSVADSLQVTLRGREQKRLEQKETESLAAYVSYLKGRVLLHDRSERAIKSAKEEFENAIKEDPSYARAYAGLADTSMILGDYLLSPIPESLELAKSFIKKALELDPDLAEAHVSLAYSLIYDYKFEEAEREFRLAISLNPSYAPGHHWYANCLADLGRKEDSFAEICIAEQLDPLSSIICLSAIYSCVELGKYDEARERLRKLSEIEPSSPLVDEGYMIFHFARREWDDAQRFLNRMQLADPTDPYLVADYAYICAATGKRDEALKLVEKLKNEVPKDLGIRATLIAFVYAGLEDTDQCFKWLWQALEDREVFYGWFKNYPLLENVRSDPRFSQLLKAAGLS